jgi:hypothetical protein
MSVVRSRPRRRLVEEATLANMTRHPIGDAGTPAAALAALDGATGLRRRDPKQPEFHGTDVAVVAGDGAAHPHPPDVVATVLVG